MDLTELKEGLDNIQSTDAGNMPSPPVSPEAVPPAEAPWELTNENFMNDFGGMFNNNADLGEVLLQQLRARGVDTKAATEAMLRELLTSLVNDMNFLQQQLAGFMQSLGQQVQQTQAVADSINVALASNGGNALAQDVQPLIPPEAMQGGEGQLPPEAMQGGEGQLPPEAMQDSEGRVIPPELVQQLLAQVPQNNTLSDERLKQLKTRHKAMLTSRAPKHSSISSNILTACKGGY